MKRKETILSFSLGLLITILFLLLTLSWLVKSNLQEERITKYLQDNDLSFILKNPNGQENDLVEDTRNYFLKLGIPENIIENVLNSEVTKEFIGKYTTTLLNYLIYKEDKIIITTEDIETLAEENFPVIEEALKVQGLSFTSALEAEIRQKIAEYSDDIMSFFPTANLILNKLEGNHIIVYKNITLENVTSFLNLVTSKKWLIIISSLTLVSVLILSLWHFRKKQFLKCLQMICFSYMGVCILIEILLGTIVKEKLMLKVESAASFINYLINALAKDIWLFIFGAFILGLIFMRIKKGKKENASILDTLYRNTKEEKR